MSSIISAVANTSDVLNNTIMTFAPAVENPTIFRVISDRSVHILVTKDAAVDIVTTDDMYVPAMCAEFIRVNPLERIEIVKYTGELDGTVWFSKQ